MKKNIILVGLGPHSKRIYMNYFKKHNIQPKILIDLKSNEEYAKKYLIENGFDDTLVWTLEDKYRDYEELPEKKYKELKNICDKFEITHIISSTEPKAHNMYLKFALENNINILSDKPITVVKGMHKLQNIEKIKKQYLDLLELYKKSTARCNIMCQRQYHKGYIYIKSLLKEIIQKYNVPITYIDIYHCDGNWEMPQDVDKENHPYKYGYGKLYHSGYHFIDLLTEFLKLNNLISEDKRITSGRIYGDVFTLDDENVVIDEKNYKEIFPLNEIKEQCSNMSDQNYKNYGERNFYGILSFYNNDNRLITTANMNLLSYGFSRRGWFKSRDYYKSNGRVRHERINIQVGPLLNIQVHSYQSKQIQDRTDHIEEIKPGGLEHFDIDIYRNVDIIGGQPFQRIQLKDLYGDEVEKEKFMGYNESSREEFITEFLNGTAKKGDLKDQQLGIEILYAATKIVYNKRKKKKQIQEINNISKLIEE